MYTLAKKEAASEDVSSRLSNVFVWAQFEKKDTHAVRPCKLGPYYNSMHHPLKKNNAPL
jgi:hypothetical protein